MSTMVPSGDDPGLPPVTCRVGPPFVPYIRGPFLVPPGIPKESPDRFVRSEERIIYVPATRRDLYVRLRYQVPCCSVRWTLGRSGMGLGLTVNTSR